MATSATVQAFYGTFLQMAENTLQPEALGDNITEMLVQ